MANPTFHFFILAPLFLICSLSIRSSASALPRKLALVQPEPLVLKYHNGPLLKGNLTVNLIWYGKFTPVQRSIIVDFIQSLSSRAHASHPSVSSWWQITGGYRGGPCTITLGKQFLDQSYSLGKALTPSQLLVLASKLPHRNAINVVLTSADVTPDRFCMSTCGAHGFGLAGKHKKIKFAYAWVGNPEKQCPGQCAWPFHQPMYGPQTPPLIAPNGDLGVDGMIMNLATVLAGAVTNPFDSGYFQGPVDGGLEAVSACTGIFGSGSYPGYPGQLLADRSTGASFNAYGTHERKYLLPAMWDPKTSACKTLV
ncbi:protein EXORDIUM-like 2 [Beta vulgaris subsp. vulgaris]|uniref:protein EXORDIUM-like 2 n=1 Tax=Beta vulgaris subsp. vulgaris TaxID=3555 RepID=UPI002036BE63|nr:protein EXORDIUM-like 2 [Beta vulgaris subsp. vulgaris]